MKRDPSLIRLSRDHHRGLALALHVERSLAAADGVTDDELAHLVIEFWETSLLPHFHAECECLLARLLRHTGLSDGIVRRTQQDHLRIHGALASLRDAGDPEARRRHLGELASLLREHIRWEESVLFEVAQRDLASEELAAVGEELSQRLPEVPPAPLWYAAGNRQQATGNHE